jgi:hypothetical protein
VASNPDRAGAPSGVFDTVRKIETYFDNSTTGRD